MMHQHGRHPWWPSLRPLPAQRWTPARGRLLSALDAYRQGVAEAPVVCKGGVATVEAGGLPRPTTGLARMGDVPRNNQAGGALTFVVSTDQVDRHGDTVSPEGWRLDEYRRNPVVLWAHDYGQPPIGRAEALWKNGRELLAEVRFAPTFFAQEVEGLYRQGFQWAVSVGFRPVRFEERRDLRSGAFLGIQFLEQELLEISAVPVPANSQALLTAHAPALSQDEKEPAVNEVVALLQELRRW